MSIIFVRHGETPLNAARVIQPPDTPLSDRGVEQARAIARRLADARVAAVLSSDLPRALQTAEFIAAVHACPLETSELLQERNFGDWRGRAYDRLGFDPLASGAAPPNGESDEMFRARVAQAFEQILATRSQFAGDLVVVSHGLVLRTLLEEHLGRDCARELPGSLANTSVTICDARAPYRVALLNCVRHLEHEQVRDDGKGLSGF
jgi:broad specificity phosphatase PhoE